MEPLLGQLQLFPFHWAPRGWASCNGQLLPINQYTALFSLLGTNYGGDGRSTFGLPDLRGRAPIHQGQGPDLTARTLGQQVGAETATLTVAQLPTHGHDAILHTGFGEDLQASSTNALLATGARGITKALPIYTSSEKIAGSLRGDAVEILDAGDGEPVGVVQPALVMNWCIALIGVFPSRS